MAVAFFQLQKPLDTCNAGYTGQYIKPAEMYLHADTYKSWISIGGPHLSLLEAGNTGVTVSHIVRLVVV